jgi:hypothetical protein
VVPKAFNLPKPFESWQVQIRCFYLLNNTFFGAAQKAFESWQGPISTVLKSAKNNSLVKSRQHSARKF